VTPCSFVNISLWDEPAQPSSRQTSRLRSPCSSYSRASAPQILQEFYLTEKNWATVMAISYVRFGLSLKLIEEFRRWNMQTNRCDPHPPLKFWTLCEEYVRTYTAAIFCTPCAESCIFYFPVWFLFSHLSIWKSSEERHRYSSSCDYFPT
jgi:hypothetical protein